MLQEWARGSCKQTFQVYELHSIKMQTNKGYQLYFPELGFSFYSNQIFQILHARHNAAIVVNRCKLAQISLIKLVCH